MLGVLYGTNTECDLAKTQNYWVNNEEEELVYVRKNEINANNVCLCALFVGVPCCYEEKLKKMSYKSY